MSRPKHVDIQKNHLGGSNQCLSGAMNQSNFKMLSSMPTGTKGDNPLSNKLLACPGDNACINAHGTRTR